MNPGYLGRFISVTIFIAILAAIARSLDWVTGSEILNIGMGYIALCGLFAVIKLPWDLYYKAKLIRHEQSESIIRGISIAENDVDYAKKIERKLLLLCFGIHIVSAIVIGIVTYFSDQKIGYHFAGLFLLSTGFRPLVEFYHHQRQRLSQLFSRCKVTREDAIDFSSRIKNLENDVKHIMKEKEESEKDHQAYIESSEQQFKQLEHELKQQGEIYSNKMDDVYNEFSRSISKLSSDEELLQGIRSFIKMVKTT